jgi:hypothetical protein
MKIDYEKLLHNAVLKAREKLAGRLIADIRYQDNDERDALAWSRRGIVLVLDDGTNVYVQSDAEGNDAGALLVIKGETASTIGPF